MRLNYLQKKNEKEQETDTNNRKGMKFSCEKYAKFTMKGIELPIQESIKKLREKKNYKYLAILEEDTIKETEVKVKIRKEYHRRTRKFLETKILQQKSHQRNKHLGSSFFKILWTILKMDLK